MIISRRWTHRKSFAGRCNFHLWASRQVEEIYLFLLVVFFPFFPLFVSESECVIVEFLEWETSFFVIFSTNTHWGEEEGKKVEEGRGYENAKTQQTSSWDPSLLQCSASSASSSSCVCESKDILWSDDLLSENLLFSSSNPFSLTITDLIKAHPCFSQVKPCCFCRIKDTAHIGRSSTSWTTS